MLRRRGAFIDIIVTFDDDEGMRYPGGKGKCYQRLINLMPVHHTYIETHLGAGAVMRHKKPANRNIGIDIDPGVHLLWEAEGITSRCEMVQADASSYLESFAFSGSELVYADPPYLAQTRRRAKVYRYDYDQVAHERLLDVLRQLPCMVMISGYESTLYADLLKGWRNVRFMVKTHTGMREECVWMNFPAPTELHDSQYLGDTYRERQTIARRQARLRERINSLSSVERSDLARWMAEAHKYAQEPQ